MMMIYTGCAKKNTHAAKAKYFHYRVKYFSENFTGYKGVMLTYSLQISAQNIHPIKSCALLNKKVENSKFSIYYF